MDLDNASPLLSEDSLAYHAKLLEKGFSLRHWEELERRLLIARYENGRMGDAGFDLMDFRQIIAETNEEFSKKG